MLINRELLLSCASQFNIGLDAAAVERFDIYARLLTEKNKVMNLTAIVEPDEIVVKHFADSLSLFSVISPKAGEKFIDVGTGAGFPGVAVLIARPDLKVTLIDGTNKKLEFIRTLCCELGLKPEIIHARAEEAGQNKALRESFDYAAARAVANLKNLCEYCLPFVKNEGAFLAMKGTKAEAEIRQAETAILLLGGRIDEIKSFNLNDTGGRNLILIRKISQTPPKYPRSAAQIAKRPLE
jgi:16S rRNA (guanine527-N7)-methyltransferase